VRPPSPAGDRRRDGRRACCGRNRHQTPRTRGGALRAVLQIIHRQVARSIRRSTQARSVVLRNLALAHASGPEPHAPEPEERWLTDPGLDRRARPLRGYLACRRDDRSEAPQLLPQVRGWSPFGGKATTSVCKILLIERCPSRRRLLMPSKTRWVAPRRLFPPGRVGCNKIGRVWIRAICRKIE
jgi:hypothetical protein